MTIIKKIATAAVLLCLIISMTACCISHEWIEANCTSPRTCSKCGKTEGEPLGHKWKDADCTTPKTCSVCGETEGEPLGHQFGEWEPLNSEKIGYKEKRICSVCSEEETRNMPRKTPQKKTVISTEKGMLMSTKEFAEYLIDYLPEGCYITDLYDDGFNIQGDAYATVEIKKSGNYKDTIYFWGTKVSGEEDLVYLTPYLAKAIDPYADKSSYSEAQKKIKDGFSYSINGVYGASYKLKTMAVVLLYYPSLNDYPMLSFSTAKFTFG